MYEKSEIHCNNKCKNICWELTKILFTSNAFFSQYSAETEFILMPFYQKNLFKESYTLNINSKAIKFTYFRY